MFALKKIDFAAQSAGRFSDTKLKPPTKWYSALYELMKNYRDAGPIRSIEALLVTLCDGDGIAVIMLSHILQWHHRGIRDDGAIWRSAEEWQQYTGLTRSQVYNAQRRERLKRAGLKIWVERAWGENTLHFLIESARLTANISNLLKLNYNVALIKLWQVVPIEVSKAKATIPFTQTGVSVSIPRVSNSQIPLTGSSTGSLTNQRTLFGGFQNDFSGNGSLALLDREKLGATEKAKYAVLSESKIRECIADANTAKASGKLIKPRLAYLRGALANALEDHEGQPHPLTPSPLHGEGKSEKPVDEAEKVVAADLPNWSWLLQRDDDEPEPEPVVSTADAASLQIWGASYNQLELQLDRASFDTWLRASVLLSVEDGVFVVGVANKYAQDMLQHRLYRNVRRVLSDVRGKTTEIRFEVVKDKRNV
jgi:hypothetical protein